MLSPSKNEKLKLGFESKISGYIASHKMLRDNDSIQEIQSIIDDLPNLENDKWPFLPKDIFKLSRPITKEPNPVQISYRSSMIHFSMSVKEIEDDLEEWLNKFETFFKKIPMVYEVNVDVQCLYSGNYKNGALNYNWKAKRNKDGLVKWKYNGDPTKLEEINKPINFSHSYFTEELKKQVIDNIQWLGDQIGKKISITDRLSTVKGNYDRHFTRTSKSEFVIEDFGVRTSGAVANIEGSNNRIEFRIDCIRRIEKEGSKLEIELVLDLNTSRLINLEIESQVITRHDQRITPSS